MGGVVNSLFGDSKVDTPDVNRPFRTKYSSMVGGTFNMDPSVRALSEESLGTTRGLLASTLKSRQDLLGNRADFIRARTNPLREQLAARRGELQRGLGRTGVRGTFANKEMTNYDVAAGRALQDANATALQEALTTEAGYTQLAQGLNDYINNVGLQRAKQELAAIGLSGDIITKLTSAKVAAQQAQDEFGFNQADLWGKIAGGVASGMDTGSMAGGIAAMFSDRRLKKNIEQVSVLPNGLPWYKFDYIWDEPAEGVMADEVEKVMPEAVIEHPSGYKMVDYNMVLGE